MVKTLGSQLRFGIDVPVVVVPAAEQVKNALSENDVGNEVTDTTATVQPAALAGVITVPNREAINIAMAQMMTTRLAR